MIMPWSLGVLDTWNISLVMFVNGAMGAKVAGDNLFHLLSSLNLWKPH